MKMCCYVNKMKRIVSVNLFLLVLAGFLSGCYNSGESRERVLKIYNWADYIGEGVLEDFQAYYKEQTGEDIHIVYQTFDINEIMLTKIEKGHEDFDVVCPSEYIIERMLKKHLLLPIDTTFAHSPNYMNNVSPFIREQINKLSQPGEEASRYAVCYMWGTAGILYNRTRPGRGRRVLLPGLRTVRNGSRRSRSQSPGAGPRSRVSRRYRGRGPPVQLCSWFTSLSVCGASSPQASQPGAACLANT